MNLGEPMLRNFPLHNAVVVGACLVGCSWAQNGLSVEQLVQRHIHALGGRSRIEAVQSTITHAEYHEGSLVAPGAFIAKMRPYYRTICDVREKIGDVCEGYDGSAWEWYTDPGVTLRVVGAAAAATRHGTEFIDSLVDYRSRGTQVQLAGEDVLDGKKVYKLHVTLADGFEKDLFLDQESFLIVGDRRSAQYTPSANRSGRRTVSEIIVKSMASCFLSPLSRLTSHPAGK
jgi:hypothetical protein